MRECSKAALYMKSHHDPVPNPKLVTVAFDEFGAIEGAWAKVTNNLALDHYSH